MRHLLEEAFSNLMEAKKRDLGAEINGLVSKHENNDSEFSKRYLVHVRAAQIAHSEGRPKAAAQHLRDAESLKSDGFPGNSAHRQDKLDKKLSRDFGVTKPTDPNDVANAYRHFDN